MAAVVLGPDHPLTLAAHGNLAHWIGAAGDATRARDQLAALVPRHERLLGREHPQTILARNNLNFWTKKA
jgi:hypothetical protein